MNSYKEVQGSVIWGRALLSAHLLAFTGVAIYRAIAEGQRPNWMLSLSIVLFIFLVANFWKMSITVDRQSLTVGFGVIRKRLLLSEISSSQPIEYRWSKYGGWGIRWGRDGSRAYSASGKSAVALQISTRRYVITTSNPEKLCQVITQLKKEIIPQA